MLAVDVRKTLMKFVRILWEDRDYYKKRLNRDQPRNYRRWISTVFSGSDWDSDPGHDRTIGVNCQVISKECVASLNQQSAAARLTKTFTRCEAFHRAAIAVISAEPAVANDSQKYISGPEAKSHMKEKLWREKAWQSFITCSLSRSSQSSPHLKHPLSYYIQLQHMPPATLLYPVATSAGDFFSSAPVLAHPHLFSTTSVLTSCG